MKTRKFRQFYTLVKNILLYLITVVVPIGLYMVITILGILWLMMWFD